MTRTVHPHELLISIGIFAILAAGLFGGGFAAGNSKATNNNLTAQLASFRESCKESMAENSLEMTFYFFDDEGDKIPGVAVGCHQKGLTDQQVVEQMSEIQNSLRINAECHNDASDWATTEMANEIGSERDIPVYVHGNCLTHNVVDVPTKTYTTGSPTFTLSTCFNGKGERINCHEFLKSIPTKASSLTTEDAEFAKDAGAQCEPDVSASTPNWFCWLHGKPIDHNAITNIPQPEGR